MLDDTCALLLLVLVGSCCELQYDIFCIVFCASEAIGAAGDEHVSSEFIHRFYNCTLSRQRQFGQQTGLFLSLPFFARDTDCLSNAQPPFKHEIKESSQLLLHYLTLLKVFAYWFSVFWF